MTAWIRRVAGPLVLLLAALIGLVLHAKYGLPRATAHALTLYLTGLAVLAGIVVLHLVAVELKAA